MSAGTSGGRPKGVWGRPVGDTSVGPAYHASRVTRTDDAMQTGERAAEPGTKAP
jgi:hypothetical protein